MIVKIYISVEGSLSINHNIEKMQLIAFTCSDPCFQNHCLKQLINGIYYVRVNNPLFSTLVMDSVSLLQSKLINLYSIFHAISTDWKKTPD